MEDLKKNWWNKKGDFKILHKINPIRVNYILKNFKNPLKKKVLDIGCGGGLLCEPLSKLGATITGIDPSNNNIEVAKLHSKEMNLNIKYICCAPENLNTKNGKDQIKKMKVVVSIEF